MFATFHSPETTPDVWHATARRPRTRVRSWKGRAAMSLQTDSAVPTFVLAGTRRTRVSEMRLQGRATRHSWASNPVIVPLECEGQPNQPHRHDRLG